MVEVRSALASVFFDEGPQAAIERSGVYFKELPIGDLITVSAWPDSFERVRDEISAALNIKIPRTYRTAVANKDYSVFMVAPRRFLIHSDNPGLSALIKPRFDTELGVVTELGHSRTRIRIQGSNACALLSRGVAIDFDSSAFPVGDFAQCAIHHMWLLLHHVSSEEEGGAYDVYVLRSFAVSFWHWLTSSAAPLNTRSTNEA